MSTVGINVQVTQTGAQQVTVQLNNIGGAAQQSARQIDTLNSALAGLGLGAALQQLQQYADAWSNVSGMMLIASQSASLAAQQTQAIYEIAQQTRQPLTDVATLYQRMSIQADALGLSTKDLTDLTKEISEVLVIQHTSAAQASGALLQFSQALSTGKVRAQEWNSIMTGLPVLAKTVADQLNTSTSAIKAGLAKGTLSSQQLAQAVLASQKTLQDEFNKSANTVTQAFTVIDNAITKYIGSMNEASGVSSAFTSLAKTISNNIDTIGNSLVALSAGLAVFVTLRTVIPAITASFAALNAVLLANPFTTVAAAVAIAATALYEFRDSIVVVQEGSVTLGDYMTAAWQNITQAATDAWQKISPYMSGLTEWFAEAGQNQSGWETLLTTVKDIDNAIIASFVAVYTAIKDVFTQLPQVVIQSITDMENSVGSSLTSFTNTVISGLNSMGADIKPIDFTPLTTGATQASLTIKDDIKAAFDTDYIGDALSGVTKKAQELASIRQLDFGAGTDNWTPVLTKQATAVDNVKKKTDTLENALRALLNQIDPVAGAQLSMAKDFDTLKKSLDAGKITFDQYGKYIDEVRAKYEDILDPVGAYTKKLQEETANLQLDGDERTIQTTLLTEELALRKQHYTITADQISQMQTAITQQVTANELAEKRNQLIQTYVQPAKDYNQSLEAAQQLYDKGTLSAQQYADAVAQINISYLDTQKTMDAGLKSGLLQVQQDYENTAAAMKNITTGAFSDMNDAIANFVTTGKLNFTDLVNNIAAGFTKLALQAAESSVISSLFGSIGGVASGTTSGTNSYGFSTGLTSSTSSISGGYGLGYASGGYTGDGGVNQVAGIVHKGEIVMPQSVVKQPGMKDYLMALASGSGTSMAASSAASTASGSGTASSGVQMNVVIQNNNAGQSTASVQQGTDANGNSNMTVIIDSLETSLAGRVQSGRGKLHKAIGAAYGLRSQPSRS